MDAFGYLSVLLSIILGWGITEILTRVGRLVEARERVKLYTPAIGWAFLLLVLHVLTWWSLFELRDHHTWNFFAFLVLLLQPVVLYLAAALALPDMMRVDSVDMRAYYYAQSRWFFGLMLALIAAAFLRHLVMDAVFELNFDKKLQLVFFVLCVGGVITRREWYHRLLLPLVTLVVCVYAFLLFAELH